MTPDSFRPSPRHHRLTSSFNSPSKLPALPASDPFITYGGFSVQFTMKHTYIALLFALLSAVSGLPAPKLSGEALERALTRLNAPEAWEKRGVGLQRRQFMIDPYEDDDDAKSKRQFMIDPYEDDDDAKSKRQFMIDPYEDDDDANSKR